MRGFLLVRTSPPVAASGYTRGNPIAKAGCMDIHDIALMLFAQLLGARGEPLDEAGRLELGREAYRCAEAFVAARDIYIRELPIPAGDATF